MDIKIKNKTHALQSSFLPLGPFRHSGLEVALQLEHFWTPMGLFPAARIGPVWSLPEAGLILRLGGGTTSDVGDGPPLLAVVGE